MLLKTCSQIMVAALLILSVGACEPAQEVDEEELGTDQFAASTTIDGHTVWAHFAQPEPGKEDRTIIDEVVRLIEQTHRGGTIRAAIYSLSIRDVANALRKAHARGVKVKVVMDGSAPFNDDGKWLKHNSSLMKLAKRLNGHLPISQGEQVDERPRDNLKFCGDGKFGGRDGCISGDPKGIMHTKFFTFSKTRMPPPPGKNRGDWIENVVWFGSANMTEQTGMRSFNNAITLYGDLDVYKGFSRYFDHLFANQQNEDDYFKPGTPRGFWTSAGNHIRVYASPEQDSDLVLQQLNKIIPDAGCEVHVAQLMIRKERRELVNRLFKLMDDGCAVRVIAGNKTDAEMLTTLVLKKEIHLTHGDGFHDKFILVNARFEDSTANRQIVFTGSHNWDERSNNGNDEIFVRLEDPTLYQTYRQHFDTAYSR